MNQTLPVWQHGRKFGASSRRRGALKASSKHEWASGDVHIGHDAYPNPAQPAAAIANDWSIRLRAEATRSREVRVGPPAPGLPKLTNSTSISRTTQPSREGRVSREHVMAGLP